MSSSLRILTMNTQLRSYGMEALAQGNPDPNTSTEERAVIISKRILQSPQDYDVICLNEVFDEDARPIFEDLLLPKYPNAVMKADLLKLDVRQNKPSPFDVLPLPPAPWSLGIGFDPVKIFELLAGKLEDSGLMLFSRLPFVQATPVPSDLIDVLASIGFGQPPGVPIVLFIPYPDSDFDDSLASKGVIYARLRSPDETILHLLMSHTQADANGQDHGAPGHPRQPVRPGLGPPHDDGRLPALRRGGHLLRGLQRQRPGPGRSEGQRRRPSRASATRNRSGGSTCATPGGGSSARARPPPRTACPPTATRA